MASGWTNRGRLRILQIALADTAAPTNYYIHLCTPATTPTAGIDTLAALTQVADGNGYSTGGYTINKDLTDWDVQTESDAEARGYLQLKNITWTASGGTIPSAGSGARWAVLADDNTALANREVYFYWDLEQEYLAPIDQTLRLQNLEVNAGWADGAELEDDDEFLLLEDGVVFLLE